MRVILTLAVAGITLIAQVSSAQDQAFGETEKILVTFTHPAITNSARPGPIRPGYSRRATSYLISVPVRRAARRIADEYKLDMIDDWPINALGLYCQVYAVSDTASIDSLLDELRGRSEVESVQRLNYFEVSTKTDTVASDPYAKLQHNLAVLELNQAHEWSRGKGARVAVVDTGADINHPDLKTQIRDHRDFVNNSDNFSEDAHGTAVAGIIGASTGNGIGIVGVAPLAKMDVLKACWYVSDKPRAICDSFTLAQALSYAVESGTDVVNLSLAGPPDPLLGRLITAAISRGIVVVAAAPETTDAGFPANVPGVIVVESATRKSPSDATVLGAPGNDIMVLVPGGSFDFASGSSLSAAQVTGIVALMTSLEPEISNSDVRRLLVDSQSMENHSVSACRALAHLLYKEGCMTDSGIRIKQTN